jgi:alkylhydroperoxidase family enzyme
MKLHSGGTVSDITAAQHALVQRILEGAGQAPHAQRRAAFNGLGLTEPVAALVNKVANHPNSVTSAHIRAAQSSGLTEDQVFEIVVCAAVGQSTRQHESALAALDLARGRSSDAPSNP